MKKLHLILILAIAIITIFVVLSLTSENANALSVSNIKLGGQTLTQSYLGGFWTTTQVIDRASFEKNPTISFDVTLDDLNQIVSPHPYPGRIVHYFATILIGSDINRIDIKNGVDIMTYLGTETGSIHTDKNGVVTIQAIPIPKNGTVTYRFEDWQSLCFDAHRYQVQIFTYGYQITDPLLLTDVYEHWDATGADDDKSSDLYGTTWRYETFSPLTTHNLNEVELKMFRVGNPGPVTVSIRKTTLQAQGALGDKRPIPSGSDLWTGIIDGNAFTTSTAGSWEGTTSTSPNLLVTAGERYAIVIRCLGGNNVNYVRARVDSAQGIWGDSPPYPRGRYGHSANSGSSWTYGNDNYMFREYGVPVTASTYNINVYEANNWKYFIFNGYGPTVDKKAGTYDPLWGWTPMYHYADYKQNQGGTHSIFIGRSNPPYLSLDGGSIVGTGMTFDTASIYSVRCDLLSLMGSVDTYSLPPANTPFKEKVPLTIVICDKNHTIIGYSQVDSYLRLTDTFPFKPWGPDGSVFTSLTSISDFKLLSYSVGKKLIEMRSAYYVYVGVKLPEYNYSNTYITTDTTFKRMNWSVDSLTSGKVIDGHTKNLKFMGVMTYFETFASYTDHPITGQFQTTPGIVANFIIWCDRPPPNGLGMPFVPVLFGFIPAIALIGVVWTFMRKWKISLPNFMYSMMAIAGLYISFAIGLIALWILALFIASLVFISLYQFREPISTVLETVGIGKEEKVQRRREAIAHRLRFPSVGAKAVGTQMREDIGIVREKYRKMKQPSLPPLEKSSTSSFMKVETIEKHAEAVRRRQLKREAHSHVKLGSGYLKRKNHG
jgi:hypothetical protein